MKKIVSIFVALLMLIPVSAWACEETDISQLILSVKAESSVSFNDRMYLPVMEDHTFAGVKDENEQVRCAGFQNVKGKWISGKMDNGWARGTEAVSVRTMIVDCDLVGLTSYDNIVCTVFAPYVKLARSIVVNLFGEDAVLCNATIGVGMIYMNGDYASLIFAPSYVDRLVIGTVSMNGGEDVTPLCVRNFDGELRFSLMCGYAEAETYIFVDTNITAEAQANAEAVARAQVEANARANASAYAYASTSASVQNNGYADQSGDGCNRNNVIATATSYNTYQIGLFNFVKNCYKRLTEEQ